MKSPSIPKPPPVPNFAEATPMAMRRAEDKRRRMMARLGRQGTILTGLGGASQSLGLVG